jgi:hypothetical protein
VGFQPRALILDRLAVDVAEDHLEELPDPVQVPAVDATPARSSLFAVLGEGFRDARSLSGMVEAGLPADRVAGAAAKARGALGYEDTCEGRARPSA